MMRLASPTLATLFFINAATGFAYAQDGNGAINIDPTAHASDTTTPVSQVDAALEIAELGREVGDPILLVAAARVLNALGSSTPDGTVGEETPLEDPSSKPAGEAREKSEEASKDPAAVLLSEARRMARGNELVMAAIADTEGGSMKGSLRGPGTYSDVRVGSLSRLTIQEAFRGSELAEVAIVGDGDTDVDLFIYDENGNEICSSTGSDDREYCRWTPRWTGTFTIELRNFGGVYNAVNVLTN